MCSRDASQAEHFLLWVVRDRGTVSDSGDRIIADRYRLTALLGQGGMGSVWRATHLNLGSEVAIKLINPAVADNPEVQERFVREAKAAAGLSSPHVVQVMDYGVDGDTPYIVMELLQGESLSERLDAVGKLSQEDTARIITEVARALTKSHEAGIVHRDLKPDNIFLVKNDDTEVTKVLDFGVAKDTGGIERAHMTSTGAIMGTPFYMSPEQAEGSKEVDQRTDVWALGVIAYECILGARPFGSESLGGLFLAICTRPMPVPSYRGKVPPGFDAWFEKATARNPEERFSSVKEAAAALREICLPDRESVLPPLTAQTIGGVTTRHLSTPDETRIAAPLGDHSQFAATPSGRASRVDTDTLASHTHDPRRSPTRFRKSVIALLAVGCVSIIVVALSGRSGGDRSKLAASSAAPLETDVAPKPTQPISREVESMPAPEPPPPAQAEHRSQEEPILPPPPAKEQVKSLLPPTPKRAPASSASRPTSGPEPETAASPEPDPSTKPRFDLGI